MKKPAPNFQGFTLIELLVVISIIAILAVVSVSLFGNATKAARDAKKKADLNTIAKVYETYYDFQTGKYNPPPAEEFSDGQVPQMSEGSIYSGTVSASQVAFQLCIPLAGHSTSTCNSPSQTCYCKQSMRGDLSSVGVNPGTYHPQSCDPQGTLDDGLVGWWKMDEDAGSSVADSSGNSLTGTAVGTVIEAGKFGNARRFNGSTDKINMGNSPTLNLTSAITMSAWVKLYGYATNAWDCRLFGKQIYRDPSNNTKGYAIQYGAGIVWGAVGNGTTAWQEYSGGAAQTIASPYWRHVAVTYDSASGQTFGYADGAKVYGPKTFTPPIDPNTNGNFYIVEDPYKCFTAIDDVRVYNRALSPTEIAALWNSNNGCTP